MQNLIDELKRLFEAAPDGQAGHVAFAFPRLVHDGEAKHWTRLCAVAHAVQADLGLPAPAVSISGAGAYGLWLPLAHAVPMALAQEFMERLCAAYCPELPLAADAASRPAALPPYLEQASGKWAAFINPGMGAAFAGDEGLEMQPPAAGQLALLEGVERITPAQFAYALDQLRRATDGAPLPSPASMPGGLLLKDATLEDIVNFLHTKNIEPTFRFLK